MFAGKTVYIFGAGASAHVGAPLLKDFLKKARELYRKQQELVHLESFKYVFDWIDEYRQNPSPAQIDFENLEDVFSMVDMGGVLGDAQAISVRNHLVNVIFETLDVSIQGKFHKDFGFIDSSYATFAYKLRELNDARKRYVRSGTYRQDALISFNYDLLLDLSLLNSRWKIDYHGPVELEYPVSTDPTIDLYKLHGSMNWIEHKSCAIKNGADVRIVHASGIPKRKLKDGTQAGLSAFIDLKKQKCESPGCNVVGELSPVFVPPTWAKNPSSAWMGKLWAEALITLRDAEQIVVIGYSLPSTDAFFKYLLALGLHKNSELRRVKLVNPGLHDGLADRFRKVFPNTPIEASQNSFESFTGQMESFVTQ